ncbi:MAG: peptidylprolyl isomerase [Gemmatimonadetes bacterium]|nr:peptidylprolyl isomerase [Gemmatimonadota bacterium]
MRTNAPMRGTLAATIAACVLAAPAVAQAQDTRTPPRTELLAWIVAVVGDSAILRSDIDAQLNAWRQQNRRNPTPEEQRTLEEQILEDRINDLLLLQAAQRDTSIHVEPEDVNQAVDARIAQVQAQYGSPAGLETALAREGLTIQSYRETLGAQIRSELYVQAYVAKVRRTRRPPPVTDAEIREFFEHAAAQNQVPQVPPTIVFEQVVIPIRAADSAIAVARAKADSILQLIRVEGQDFATLARRFSEDPGSRDVGGDVGWFRPGSGFVEEFERAAFLLRPGEVSDPVLSSVGFHLIKVDAARGPERKARHILIRPVITDDDAAAGKAIADTVLTRLRAGARLDSLRRQYGDPDERVRIGPVPSDSLPAEYRLVMTGLQRGDFGGPFRIEGAVPQWVVARITETHDARPATVDDYRDFIQQQIAQGKLYQEILAELRRRTYIEIRKPPGDPGS